MVFPEMMRELIPKGFTRVLVFSARSREKNKVAVDLVVLVLVATIWKIAIRRLKLTSFGQFFRITPTSQTPNIFGAFSRAIWQKGVMESPSIFLKKEFARTYQ